MEIILLTILTVFVVLGIRFLALPHAAKMLALKLSSWFLLCLEFLAGPGILMLVIAYFILKKG
jgi:uncharacterized membrane protein